MNEERIKFKKSKKDSNNERKRKRKINIKSFKYIPILSNNPKLIFVIIMIIIFSISFLYYLYSHSINMNKQIINYKLYNLTIKNNTKSNNNSDDKELSEIYSMIINKKRKTFIKKEYIEIYNSYIDICLKDELINKAELTLSTHPKISIILPLYNASQYLHYSLRSIQNQNFKDIEIIIIDDNSPDDTLLKVKKYMEEDPRIKLIENKENRKIMYSKSLAALNAKGKYIMQLDQDDLFIRDDVFEMLYNEAESNELDLTQIRDIFSPKLKIGINTTVNFLNKHFIFLYGYYLKPIETHIKNNTVLKDTIFLNGCLFPLWGLLIKSELYKNVIYKIWPILMNYKVIFYEDYLVSTIIVAYTKKYKYINKFGLIHLDHKKSASNQHFGEIVISLLFFSINLYEYYIKYNPKDIRIMINLIKRYSSYYDISCKYYPNLLKFNIKQILSNKYLKEKDLIYMKKVLKRLGPDNFDIWNSFEDFMKREKFEDIYDFQNKSISNSTLLLNKDTATDYKISIIVYATKMEYLMETLNSIVNQDFSNYELILVFDSNETKSIEKLDDYSNSSEFFKIIKNNGEKDFYILFQKEFFYQKVNIF